MKDNNYNLCIDIGNTRYKLGVFLKDELVSFHYCNDEELEKVVDRLQNEFKFIGLIVSSVRNNISNSILKLADRIDRFIILDQSVSLPIEFDYSTPETLGKDRIAAAVGAQAVFPGKRVIIVDAGTCITYDFIDEKGIFQGGNIAPGMQMRLQAMHDYTSKLPLPPLEMTNELLAKSTVSALQNGAIQGTIFEIESFIREIEKKFGKSKLILTGGDANYFVDKFKSMIFVVQNLVLIGLNKIINHNV